MKIVIWGTGKYYNRYKSYLSDLDIVCLVDSKASDDYCIKDGYKIIKPEQLKQISYEYIVVLIKNYQEVVKEAEQLNICTDRIRAYNEIGELLELQEKKIEQYEILGSISKAEANKCIPIIIPGLSLTGAPIALKNLAICIKKMGYESIILSLEGGPLQEELEKNNIMFVDDISCVYGTERFLVQMQKFPLFILGCTVVSDVGRVLSSLGIPIMWWLHESETSYYEGYPLITDKHIKFYGVGHRVIDKFHSYYPNETIKELYYDLPEVTEYSLKKKKGKVKIAVIGYVCNRKAQDIFVRAINKLDLVACKKAEFIIVGRSDNGEIENVMSLARDGVNINYLGELSQEEIREFYKELDILVCPSRDDPMPIVVTEAIMNSIPCIVSNQVGQSSFLKEFNFGECFESEDVEGLSIILDKMIMMSRKELEAYSMSAKAIYYKYFSEQAMEENVKLAISELMNL